MRTARPEPSGIGHVFGAPTGGCMGLTCFANGSLARERVRDAYGLDWAAFDAALRRTPPGNGGALMLPWSEPEITPRSRAPACAGATSIRQTRLRTSAQWSKHR